MIILQVLPETLLVSIGVVIKWFLKTISNVVAGRLLFEGGIRDEYRTENSLNKITERYEESIKDLNRALTFNIGFIILALYIFFILPVTGYVELPIVGLSLSRNIWISIVPLISFGLQVLILTSFIWFMSLRISLKILRTGSQMPVTARSESEDSGKIIISHPTHNDNDFADFTNLLLKGAIGQLWIVFRIRDFFRSSWNYVWYIPVLFLIITVMISPLLVCLFFIIQLFMAGSYWLGLIYSIFFIPFFVLFLILIGTAALLGIREDILV